MGQPVIETKDLTVYYGRRRGIIDVDLEVQAGEIFGFLGPNGAGKTTTVRVLLDVIRPGRGQRTIFGLDCQRDGVQIRSRVGYLPDELRLPDNITAQQFFDVMATVRGMRGPAYRRELCERLDLDPSRRLREYSHGNKRKVGLIAAMMHQPDLLILDEPTIGLDPLVQRTVLELVEEARREARTVFFSSHILPEVQAVCDRVGILREGRLVAVESVESLVKRQFRRLRLTLEKPPGKDTFVLDGVTEIDRSGDSVTLEARQNIQAVMERAIQYGIVDIEEQPVTLEEIFLAYYGANERHQGGGHV